MDSKRVLTAVTKALESDKNRSMWRRLQSEMSSAGIGAADTYLRSAFSEVTQEVKESLESFKESLREA